MTEAFVDAGSSPTAVHTTEISKSLMIQGSNVQGLRTPALHPDGGAIVAEHTTILWKSHLALEYAGTSTQSADGRIVMGLFRVDTVLTRVVAIYTPADDQSKPAFLSQLLTHLQEWHPLLPHIITGDWNCVADPMDSSNPNGSNGGQVELLDLINQLSLSDCYRLVRLMPDPDPE
ncbi:hypothetical protein V1514DRAFT_343947 [Lipomyces japonicus]|uniref:uncharacterized protein n=1 Tax=Lipomyces japonicus TaxID=56871 RepID=UPI0034CFC00A